MKPGMRFIKEWTDEDMDHLRVEICDGRSCFVNHIYVGHRQLRSAVAGLDTFKDRIYGGIFDLRFGKFGPGYATGAFDARLQFRQRGKILVRVLAQSGFAPFEEEELASEATLHLVTEPALLDEFILGLRALSEGKSQEAGLEAIDWTGL